jgi:hypothetical protein
MDFEKSLIQLTITWETHGAIEVPRLQFHFGAAVDFRRGLSAKLSSTNSFVE